MIPAEELNKLMAVSGLEELWDMHTRRMAAYGFDRLIYGYTRYLTANSFGDPDDFVLLCNHDPAYMDTFIGDGLFFNAPMVRWALDNDGAKSWSHLQEMLQDCGLSD